VLARITEKRLLIVRWLLLLAWCGLIAGLLTMPTLPFLTLWWSAAIPAFLLCVLVLGHDTWRRICPLSALNQVPRLFGIGRTTKVAAGSWLSRHALMVQFTVLTACVVLRLTVLNQSSEALGIFLIALLGTALLVGFLAGGKSWCHFACPLAPVQMVYSGPRGLLATPAALGGSGPGLSQSMCRNVRDEPTCVACHAPCPDIDLEKSYWEQLEGFERRAVVYGYLGLAAGYVIHVRGALPIVWAGPVVVAAILLAIGAGALLERALRAGEATRHRLMTLATVLAFGLLIAGALLPSLPQGLRLPVAALTSAAAATWSWNVWRRTRRLWQREAMASVFRRRLAELPLDLSPHLDGRTLDQLSTDEVGVLAAVLPGLNQSLRQRLYQGVLTDAAAAGQLGSADGDAMLGRLRSQLHIPDDQHELLVAALPTAGSIKRLDSYRQAVERLVLDGLSEGEALDEAIERRRESLSQLRAAYSVTDEEQEQVVFALVNGDGLIGRAGSSLLAELERLCAARAALGTAGAEGFLRAHLDERGRALATQFNGVQAALGTSAAGQALAVARTAAAIDPDLVPGASGRIAPLAVAEVRTLLGGDADPIVAAVARQPTSPAVVLRLALAGEDVPCREATARIGRDPASTVVVTHPQASRNHCLVGLDADGAWLHDLGSGNGTLVDGRLVRGARVRLRANAVIRIGSDGPSLAVGARDYVPSDRVDLFLALRASALGTLPQAVLWDLAEVSALRLESVGSRLIEEGAPVWSLLVLVGGTAVATSGGRTVGEIAVGETIGELALISEQSAAVTVTAVTACTTLAIPGIRVASLLARHPGVATALLMLTGRRLASAAIAAND